MKPTTTVLATYPVFLEIARRRQTIRRVLQTINTRPVTNQREGGAYETL